jgi:single-strand DNA-binding protein
MNNLNSILLEGNLVRDPVLNYPPRGAAICNIIVASSRVYKTEAGLEKEVGYFEVEVYGKLGEAIYEKGKKGRGIRVVGRIKQERWIDKDCKQHSRIFIVTENIELRPEFDGINKSDNEYQDNNDYVPVDDETVESPLAETAAVN